MLKIIQWHAWHYNYLRQTDNAVYTPVGFVDSESRDGSIKEGEWRSMKGDDEKAFKSINPVRGSRYTKDGLKVRETLTKYVNSENGSVPWQFDYILDIKTFFHNIISCKIDYYNDYYNQRKTSCCY